MFKGSPAEVFSKEDALSANSEESSPRRLLLCVKRILKDLNYKRLLCTNVKRNLLFQDNNNSSNNNNNTNNNTSAQ